MNHNSLCCVVVFSIFNSISGCSSSSHNQTQPSQLVIKKINIIDVESGSVSYSQDVVIEDKRIVFIGDSFSGRNNSKATLVDGKGKYLMPGLWDMHFHLCWQNNNDSLIFPVLLKYGVTGIRDMGGDLTIMQAFKRRMQDKEHLGPKIYGAGPMIDGNPPVQRDFSFPVDEKTNISKELDSLKNNGADFFKTYSLINERQLIDISIYCRKNNMTFAGHLSEYVNPEISLALGQKSVEHLNRLDDIWATDKSRLDSIGNMMVLQKTFLCPTLITYNLKTRLRDSSVKKTALEKYIPSSLKNEWNMIWEGRVQRAMQNADWDRLNMVYASQKQLVSHLNKMGVMILAGSDFAGMPYVYPGVGLHEELILLAECGLSNAEVLRSATINPAIFLSRQQLYGSIATGKVADLIILDNNPLEEITNIQSIHSVIVEGKIVM